MATKKKGKHSSMNKLEELANKVRMAEIESMKKYAGKSKKSKKEERHIERKHHEERKHKEKARREQHKKQNKEIKHEHPIKRAVARLTEKKEEKPRVVETGGEHEERRHEERVHVEHRKEQNKEIKHEHEERRGQALASYKLEVDKAVVEVEIEKNDLGVVYNLKVPGIEPGTQALLDEIRKELVATTILEVSEITDQKSLTEIKKRFMEESSRLFEEKIPGIAKETKEFLIGFLMQEMLGLGRLEFLINDTELEEIVVVSSKEPVRVYHKKFGWLITNIFVGSEDDINNYSNIIARRVGRQITVLNPLLDAHVVTGDRANAVLYPISTKGNTITIRKFARDPWTIVDLIQNKTVSIDVACLLWLAIEYEMNVLISGGTASGKTSFLNACMPFIPPNHRVISIEDTRELMLPDFLYWCPLVTRTANPEGKGEVSMLDLLINSLRMRPDRIVLGEMRRQKEAEVLFEAMHTGHSVYATVHADTAAETISRLTNPPINVPPNLIKAVNLNVVMFRDRRKGLRRVSQLAEFITGKDSVSANILYRWVPEKDEILPHNSSLTFFEELSRHTGMSQAEINQNIKTKKEIFSWLIKNNIRSLEEVGKVLNRYYANQALLLEIIRKNQVEKIKKK
jgi:flagellar protein FlaI